MLGPVMLARCSASTAAACLRTPLCPPAPTRLIPGALAAPFYGCAPSRPRGPHTRDVRYRGTSPCYQCLQSSLRCPTVSLVDTVATDRLQVPVPQQRPGATGPEGVEWRAQKYSQASPQGVTKPTRGRAPRGLGRAVGDSEVRINILALQRSEFNSLSGLQCGSATCNQAPVTLFRVFTYWVPFYETTGTDDLNPAA